MRCDGGVTVNAVTDEPEQPRATFRAVPRCQPLAPARPGETLPVKHIRLEGEWGSDYGARAGDGLALYSRPRHRAPSGVACVGQPRRARRGGTRKLDPHPEHRAAPRARCGRCRGRGARDGRAALAGRSHAPSGPRRNVAQTPRRRRKGTKTQKRFRSASAWRAGKRRSTSRSPASQNGRAYSSRWALRRTAGTRCGKWREVSSARSRNPGIGWRRRRARSPRGSRDRRARAVGVHDLDGEGQQGAGPSLADVAAEQVGQGRERPGGLGRRHCTGRVGARGGRSCSRLPGRWRRSGSRPRNPAPRPPPPFPWPRAPRDGPSLGLHVAGLLVQSLMVALARGATHQLDVRSSSKDVNGREAAGLNVQGRERSAGPARARWKLARPGLGGSFRLGGTYFPMAWPSLRGSEPPK